MLRKVRFVFTALVTLFAAHGRADFSLTPRYEYITANSYEFANRLLLKSKLNFTHGDFGFYLDGFGEFDANKAQSEIRRSPPRGYLQEAYGEYKKDAIYIRAGRQALRWSEMWVVPSLDIWTARRWNRLYIDPLSEQLVHPTGLSLTYAVQDFSVDVVGITNLAENTYPEPVPSASPPKSDETNAGLRLQYDIKGFHFSGLAAKQEKKLLYGLSANYAFESAVPKLEVGLRRDTAVNPTFGRRDESFAALGLDLFLGSWVITPQVTVFDYGELRQASGEKMSILYTSVQWKVEPHDFQAMGFVNPTNKDSFWSLSYSYNVNSYFSAGGFLQEYYGENQSLHWLYRDMTRGVVAGLRLEFSSDWAF